MPTSGDFRILTPRLLLRDFVADDWPAVHAYVSDPEVVRYLMFPPQSEDGTRQYVARMIGYAQQQPRTHFYLAIVRRQEGDVIGNINLACSGGELGEAQQGSFSYQLRRDAWGQGFATEAMRAMLEFGFQTLRLHRISDFADPANHASMRVMEKLGMRREGHLVQNYYTKKRWRDAVVYAILAEEWRAQQAAQTQE